MNLMEHNYHDNRDNVLHCRDIGILIIAQPYSIYDCTEIYNLQLTVSNSTQLVAMISKSYTLQLTAKFTLACAIHVCVVQFCFSVLLELVCHMRVTYHAPLKSELSTTRELDFVCSARKLDFLYCTQVRVEYYT